MPSMTTLLKHPCISRIITDHDVLPCSQANHHRLNPHYPSNADIPLLVFFSSVVITLQVYLQCCSHRSSRDWTPSPWTCLGQQRCLPPDTSSDWRFPRHTLRSTEDSRDPQTWDLPVTDELSWQSQMATELGETYMIARKTWCLARLI